MGEKEHLIDVLKEAKFALKSDNSLRLQHLSDETIHSSSIYQHTDYIVTAVIIYALSKLAGRRDKQKIKGWSGFLKKTDSYFDLAIKSLEQNNSHAFIDNLERIKKLISGISGGIKSYAEEVIRKASINKASKIYEHGISLERTVELLGITRWELADYVGQKNIADTSHNITLNEQRRAKIALEFFS